MIGTAVQVAEAILEITAPEDGKFPENSVEAAKRWGHVADVLGSGVVPASTTTVAARTAFEAVVANITNESNGLNALKQAFVQYAAVLASGMTAGGFTGVAPFGPPALESVLGVNYITANAVANSMAAILTTWMLTGVATPISGGVPILWT